MVAAPAIVAGRVSSVEVTRLPRSRLTTLAPTKLPLCRLSSSYFSSLGRKIDGSNLEESKLWGMSSAGFAGAPVSKSLAIVTAISTLVVLQNNSQDTAALIGVRVFGDDGQWWRLLTSMFPLGSVWELILCLNIIRVFRILERHLGSAKFGSFLFLAASLSKSIELALCVEFPFFRPPLGPLPILSAVGVAYYGYIPSTAPAYLTIGNVRVTGKFFAYAAVLVLAFHDTYNSAMSAGCGVVVALLYWSNQSPLQSFRIPGRQLFTMYGAAFPGGNQIEARRAQITRIQNRVGRGRQADRMLAGVAGAGVGPATGLRQRMEIRAPSEEDITLLMGLGFDRETVVRVLRSSGNNTEAAANRLLGH